MPCTSKMHYQLPFVIISVIWGPHADHLGKRCTSHYALSRAKVSMSEQCCLIMRKQALDFVCNDARSCKHTHTNHDDSWIHDGIYFFFELTRPRTEWCWCIVDVSCFSLECESITRSSSQTYCQQTKLIKVEITRILWRGWFSSVYIYID